MSAIRSPSDNDDSKTNGSAGSSSASASYKVIASAKRAQTSLPSSQKRAKTDGASSADARPLAPLFRRTMHSSASDGVDAASTFVWRNALGPDMSCLYGEFGKPFARDLEARQSGAKKDKVKVACFDLDGCLVKPKNGRTWPSASDPFDFEQAFRGTFERVKREYEQGDACIAIVSNQFQNDVRSKKLDTWRTKMTHIARAIDCPLLVLAALTRDGYRKPGRRMWDHGVVEQYVKAGGKREDIVDQVTGAPADSRTFFVGDAAGRVGDHADTDRKWATNVGMTFIEPEAFFLDRKPKAFSMSGWQPTIEGVQDERATLPFNFFGTTDVDAQTLDLVLFVGPPAAGKTSFFQRHFAGRDYAWVNQDTLGTAAKCVNAVRKALEAGRSVVVDNTNRNVSTRAKYIELAKMLGNVRVRCVYFDVSKELCKHNNFFRVRAGLQPSNEVRQLLPDLAFNSYFSNVEPPKKEEGFASDIVTVQWSFQGDEEAKRRWLLRWE